jgi:lipopolysaccharide/colanic/teichoic acid biosynthesis glycosyltransferase
VKSYVTGSILIEEFRSMIMGADRIKDQLMDQNEAGEVMFKIKRDPRITRVGRIIRKLSRDFCKRL